MAFTFRDLRKMGWTHVHEKISATTHFLNGKTDVRSSYYLEDPAAEFDIQGLELDWEKRTFKHVQASELVTD